MTKEQAKHFLPLIQAWAEGRDIQYRDYRGVWTTRGDMDFSGDAADYRVKPFEFPALPEGDEYFNPLKLTPEEFGVDKGWRPVTKREIREYDNEFPYRDFQYWSYRKGWFGRIGGFLIAGTDSGGTLRTKLPIPPPNEYQEMTVGEIEKILGKKIKIVKERN
jgi:hypothetical protein